jgi:hypothetical protein
MANNGAASGFFDVAAAGGTGISTWNTTAWPINTWIFYVGEYDGTHVYSYAFWGGALKDTGSTGATTGAVIAGSANITIGKDAQYATPDEINASMDDVRIYNRALTMSEIRQLYTQTGKSNGFFIVNSR